MAVIVMADDGIAFDGDSLARGPLGGAETAFISLAEAFAGRGHAVTIYNKCALPMTRNGVAWEPIEHGLPRAADLYIANRGDRLLPLVPSARSRVFWIHNPAGYLKKWRYLSKLWWRRPAMVFSSQFHANSFPAWAPSGARVTIPYGISPVFLDTDPPREPPPPRAVFTSSPLRSLDWLLDLWVADIHPHIPAAELHVFSSPKTYGGHGAARATQMNAVLDRATALAASGVVLRDPLPKAALATEMAGFRTLLYRGDPGETFCLAVGEAQAVGLPCVVQDIGCVAERVIDGVTGYVAPDDAAFAARALSLLQDDALWRRQHEAALAHQRGWSWDDAAAQFEQFVPA
jgi:glycosyltransferase involved in cell wall biosynthesis